jgi:hypothetical protein
MMESRLAGKRVIVTDCNEYNGADTAKLQAASDPIFDETSPSRG